MAIEDFDSIAGTLRLAKALQRAGRFDVVERYFNGFLCEDSYFENMLNVIASLFTKNFFAHDGEEGAEVMGFEDEVISNYFVHAVDYGKRHGLACDENPYVAQARAEVGAWLTFSFCTSWHLLGYTKTRRAARKSKLIVYRDLGCPCDGLAQVAHGLIQIHCWFANKCAEFDAERKAVAA